MRIGIFDTIETPQRFNLVKLFGILLGHLGSDATSWVLIRSEGYGLDINALGERIETDQTVTVSVDKVVGLLPGIDQWFYWFEAVNQDGSVRFGLVDSSFMFVEGSPDLLRQVEACFSDTREV